jgi:glycogen synthase
MLSWEYPPLVIGGISAHADGLARALARAGHEVVVLTLHHPDAPEDAVVDGVRVVRARAELPWLPDDHFVAHMAGANHHLVAAGAPPGGWRPAWRAGGPTWCTPTTGWWRGPGTRCT